MEIFSLGIQNSKNVMFWLLFRELNNYRHGLIIEPVSSGFPMF